MWSVGGEGGGGGGAGVKAEEMEARELGPLETTSKSGLNVSSFSLRDGFFRRRLGASGLALRWKKAGSDITLATTGPTLGGPGPDAMPRREMRARGGVRGGGLPLCCWRETRRVSVEVDVRCGRVRQWWVCRI